MENKLPLRRRWWAPKHRTSQLNVFKKLEPQTFELQSPGFQHAICVKYPFQCSENVPYTKVSGGYARQCFRRRAHHNIYVRFRRECGKLMCFIVAEGSAKQDSGTEQGHAEYQFSRQTARIRRDCDIRYATVDLAGSVLSALLWKRSKGSQHRCGRQYT